MRRLDFPRHRWWIVAIEARRVETVRGLNNPAREEFLPEGVDDAAVRSTLLNEYNLEIGAGLGAFAGKAWRIGLMGYAARSENVTLCLAALKAALKNK